MNRFYVARGWGAGTAVLGVAMLSMPGTVAGLVSGGASSPSSVIVRVLGARQLLQGVAVVARPGRGVVLTGIVVDTLHAASMVAAAWWSPRYRRPALISAAVAAGSAVVGTLISRVERP